MKTILSLTPLLFFAGKKRPDTTPCCPADQAVEKKLTQLKADLTDLVAWDKTEHSKQPVLQEVRLDRILKTFRRFLHRQAHRGIHQETSFNIGIAGGTASGKTTTKKRWMKLFPKEAARVIDWRKFKHGKLIDGFDLDMFYKDYEKQRKEMGDKAFFSETNLDEPSALTLKQARDSLKKLSKGQAVRIPYYNMRSGSRREGMTLKNPAPFLVVEGLFTFVPRTLRKLFHLKVFVSADQKTRTERWWARAHTRNVKPDEAGHALFNRSMAMHDQNVEPTKKYADIVIENSQAALPQIDETLKRLTRLLLKTVSPAQLLTEKTPKAG